MKYKLKVRNQAKTVLSLVLAPLFYYSKLDILLVMTVMFVVQLRKLSAVCVKCL